jgi:hypothetical protein
MREQLDTAKVEEHPEDLHADGVIAKATPMPK